MYEQNPEVTEAPMDHSLLKDYIAYARTYCHPILSKEVRKKYKHRVLVCDLAVVMERAPGGGS